MSKGRRKSNSHEETYCLKNTAHKTYRHKKTFLQQRLTVNFYKYNMRIQPSYFVRLSRLKGGRVNVGGKNKSKKGTYVHSENCRNYFFEDQIKIKKFD